MKARERHKKDRKREGGSKEFWGVISVAQERAKSMGIRLISI